MLKKDLAQALGISGAMVSKLAKRGMPTDTLERAQRWRKRHLEPGRVKGVRMGTAAPALAAFPEKTSRNGADVVPAIETMAQQAGDFWASFPNEPEAVALLQELRPALRQMPDGANPRLPLRVWLFLGDYCLHDNAAVRQHPDGNQCLTAPEFAFLVCPHLTPTMEWLDIACDWSGYAVNGWPEGWDQLDD